MLTRLFVLFIVLCAVPCHAGRVVVMRGVYDQTARTNVYDYVGDETSLAAATLAGVTGDEIIEANRLKLRAEVDLYYAAQRAAGVAQPKPLYVLLDAKGDWVYARWSSSLDGHPVRLTADDGTTTLVGGARTASAGLTAVPVSDARATWRPVSAPLPAPAVGEIAVPSTTGGGPRTITPATLPDDLDLNRR